MSNLSRHIISFALNISSKPILRLGLDTAISEIKEGKYRERIAKGRTALASSREAYDAYKKTLPVYYFNALFNPNKMPSCKTVEDGTHLLLCDVDHLTPEQLAMQKNALLNLPSLLFLFTSPSGTGYKFGIRLKAGTVTDDASFKRQFHEIEIVLHSVYGIRIDKACKDIRRACFVSYDPEAYYNEGCEEWRINIPKGERNNTLYRLARTRGSYTEEENIAYYQRMLIEDVDVSCNLTAFLNMMDRVEGEEEGSGHKEERAAMLRQYAYVKESNKFLDLGKGLLLGREAVNFTTQACFKGKGNASSFSRWMAVQPGRVVVDAVTFKPSAYKSAEEQLFTHNGLAYANSWRGFNVVPKEGTVEPWLRLVRRLFTEEDAQCFIDYCIYMVKHPDKKCQWHPAIIGIEGAGKDSLFVPFFNILGGAASKVSNASIKSNYDDEFVGTKLVLVHDADSLKREAIDKIKEIGAGSGDIMLTLNKKNEGKFRQLNLYALPILANSMDCLSLSRNERRIWIVNLKDALPMDEAEKKAYYTDWLEKGGAGELLHWLLAQTLSETFNPNRRPDCQEALNEMYEGTRADWESALTDLLEMQEGPFVHDFVHSDNLRECLLQRDMRCSSSKIGVWLRRNGYYRTDHQIQCKINGKMHKASTKWHMVKEKLTMSDTELYHAIKVIEVQQNSRNYN